MKKEIINRAIFFPFICGLLTFLSGCASMYIPSSTNIPLLEEKNEVQIDLGASTNSIHLAGSYAVTEKWALMLNGSLSYRNFSKNFDIFNSEYSHTFYFDSGDNDFAHKYLELGAGRYNMLNSRNLRLEIFGGGGYGESKSMKDFADYNPYSYYKRNVVENRYLLLFTQANFGIKEKIGEKAGIEFGCALRLAYSHFFYKHTMEPYLSAGFNNIHIEPALLFRIGTDNIRLFIRGGLALPLTFESYEDGNSYRGLGYKNKPSTTQLHISAGVNIRIKGSK